MYVRSASPPPAESVPQMSPFYPPDDLPSLDSASHQPDPSDLRPCACLAGGLFMCPVPFDDGNGMLVQWCGFATGLSPAPRSTRDPRMALEKPLETGSLG